MESKRIKVIAKQPNPLFKQWLREWIDDAEKKKKKISKTYEKALDSLNKYPLTLFSGHDCAILESFGPKICQMLDEKLEQHLNEQDGNSRICFKDKIAEQQEKEAAKRSDLIASLEAAGLIDDSFAPADLSVVAEDVEMQEVSLQIEISSDEVLVDEQENISPDILADLISSSAESEDSFDRLLHKYESKDAKRKKLKRKQPAEAEVIKRRKNEDDVVVLSQSPPPQAISSPVSIGGKRLKKFRTFDSGRSNLAGPSYASSPISKFLDVADVVPSSPASPVLASKFGDDSIDRLAAKYDFISPIVKKVKSPVKLARKPSNSKLKTIAEVPSTVTTEKIKIPAIQAIPEDDEVRHISVDEINPLDYNVVLLVDIQESAGKSDDTLSKLKASNVANEVRKLNVGDFLWIAQHKTIKSKEFVLPYIIERKRLDDLSSSIKDGRFHEQKFRLKQCGIENVVYLIENHLKNGKLQCGLPFTTLLQAATNTQIHSKFQVKFTENSQHTILYLTVMTSFIENIFKNKSPVKFQLMEFDKFNQAAVKQRKCNVRETFIKQLLALKGLSVDIALEITKNYATPNELYTKYLSLGKAEGENLLTKLTIGELKRKIPSTVSKTIYHCYMCDKL